MYELSKRIILNKRMILSKNYYFSVAQSQRDMNNFRKNIQNNYLTIVTDQSYEQFFNDYFFDTDDQQNRIIIKKTTTISSILLNGFYKKSFPER